ncbi:MAG: diaminopimelate decarboxylase [Ktedonobacteraceae bacterium]
MGVQSGLSAPTSHLLPDTTSYPGDMLHIANHSVSALVQKFGTPLYIYDRATIVNACATYFRAFQEYYHASEFKILYASKAYLTPLIAELIAQQGMGLDVVSSGEMLVAQLANFPMGRITLHGNNKSGDELRLALESDVGRIVLDNWNEIERLTRIAHEMHRQPVVSLRVAPDVDTDTHRYLQTDHAASKFGFPLSTGEARAAILHILKEGKLKLLGLHAHNGTMLRETRPYEESLQRLLWLAADVYREAQWWPEEISPGGGWAVETPEDFSIPGVEMLAQALHLMMQSLSTIDKTLPSPTIIIEPGRSIIARAGVAIYRIGARKHTAGGITYLFVDGGMADNIRPALYGARYHALPVKRVSASLEEVVHIAGRYCESGDVLIENVALPYMKADDLLVLPMAGAYCLPMASNYNLVPRPAALLVEEEKVQVMERRETVADLISRYPNFESNK